MYTRLFLLSLLCLVLSNLPQPTWSRSLSVSLNMSLTRNEVDDRNVSRTAEPTKLTRELLQSCMRETEISMSQLKLFRLSLLFNENSNNEAGMAVATGNGDEDVKNENSNNNNNIGDTDYGATVQLPYLDLKRNEPLQCFVRCLYEGLGLVHYDMMLEEAFKLEVQQNLQQHEKNELKECQDINSKNRCEAAYKLHLCYNYLKNMEAEQRLREVLERSDAGSDTILPDEDDNVEDLTESDKANEVIDRLSELAKAKN